ncbi:SpaH/EbpB family LPXTG-anchored major pilin [Enterococcus pingfangensis]|uniref:SpaH/EbpB family LPXTG-anchored major pilin n=1 Tax=Enterococcus pingfangensis TaxID=2559924 RepID=UPI0010F642EB|nr:SpaH/EbpB family LPXTG-anchored major pilin [Enterococcus pingfangensis]
MIIRHSGVFLFINIDSNTEGEVKNETGSAEEGAKVTGAAGFADAHKPLSGVTFKIQKVVPATGLTSSQISASDTSTFEPVEGIVESLVTGTNGLAYFDLGKGNAKDGVYLVTEVSNPSAVIDEATGKPKLIDPFVVQVPTTLKDGVTGEETVNYDVNVYPKNDVEDVLLNPVKTFEKDTTASNTVQSVKPGQTVTWNLSVKVPGDIYTAADTTAGTTESVAKELSITDNLNIKYLNFDLSKVEENKPETYPFSARIEKSDGNNVELDYPADYVYEQPKPGADKDHELHTFSLTKEGIIKVGKIEGEKTFVVSLKTIVNPVNDSTAEIINTFNTLYVGPTGLETPDTTEPEDPENPGTTIPTVVLGNIDVLKTDEANKPLQHAKFKLAATEEDAKAGNWVTDSEGKVLEEETDENGTVEFIGLVVDETNKTQEYYLVETSAPIGFDIDGKIHKVIANTDQDTDVTKTDDNIQDIAYEATVINVDNKLIPNLPATGDDARLILLITASTLIVAGGVAVIHYRRKEQANS